MRERERESEIERELKRYLENGAPPWTTMDLPSFVGQVCTVGMALLPGQIMKYQSFHVSGRSKTTTYVGYKL